MSTFVDTNIVSLIVVDWRSIIWIKNNHLLTITLLDLDITIDRITNEQQNIQKANTFKNKIFSFRLQNRITDPTRF